jgi:hypothetical protein
VPLLYQLHQGGLGLNDPSEVFRRKRRIDTLPQTASIKLNPATEIFDAVIHEWTLRRQESPAMIQINWAGAGSSPDKIL